MIIELMALNASFAVLKEGLNNGRDLVQMGQALSKWFTASSEINKKPGNKVGQGSALESWQAQELIRRQRKELEFAITKTRLQAWSDFIAYEAQWHRERKEEAHALRVKKAARAKAMAKNLNIAITVGLVMIGAMGLLIGVAVYIKANPVGNFYGHHSTFEKVTK